jgi:hypothetical protein
MIASLKSHFAKGDLGGFSSSCTKSPSPSLAKGGVADFDLFWTVLKESES